MGFVELILLIIIVLICAAPWLWRGFQRRRVQSFRYEVCVSKPENHSSIHLIERS